MAECWARILGGCDAKISGEHVVSKALWTGPAIQAVGLPWCKTEPQTIGVASLTANILCRTHNSALSEVDAAGAAVFKMLKDFVKLGDKRERERPRRWKVRRFEIDAKRLERWFLKTLINIMVSTAPDYRWRLTHGRSIAVPDALVGAAFGTSPLAGPMGLYAVGHPGETVVSLGREWS